MPKCETHDRELTEEGDHYFCGTCRANLTRLRYSEAEVIEQTSIYATVPKARSAATVDESAAERGQRRRRSGRTGAGSRGGRGGFVGHSSETYEG